MDIAYYAGVGFFYFKGYNNSNVRNCWNRPTLKELEIFGPEKVNLLVDLLKINGSRLMYYNDDRNTFNKGTIYLKRKIKKLDKVITGRIEYEGIGSEYKTRYIIDDHDKDIFHFIDFSD